MSNLHGQGTHPRWKEKNLKVKEEISYSLSISMPERVTVMNLVLTFSVYIFVLLLHMWNCKEYAILDI